MSRTSETDSFLSGLIYKGIGSALTSPLAKLRYLPISLLYLLKNDHTRASQIRSELKSYGQ